MSVGDSMNSLTQLFTSNDVLLDLDVSDKKALFPAVAKLWQARHELVAEKIVNSLNAREELGSTGLGEGVAIPHARIDGLDKAVAAVVRTKMPIAFDAPDGKPVVSFFMLLVPSEATEQHLQILAEVAAMFSDEKFRVRLGTIKSQEEMYTLFSEWPLSKERKLA